MADTNEYVTIPEAAKSLGCIRRSLYRVIERCGGPEAIISTVLGRPVIHKSKLPVLKAAYFPSGSAKRAAAAKRWGAAGGTQKAVNAKRLARAASRGKSDAST
jgi:hypothetical protein